MEKKDMVLLIEAEDDLHNMDKALEQLSGYGHAGGDFVKLDNVFDVIHRNSHAYYSENSDEKMEIFFKILMDRDKSPEERAEILLNGTVRAEE